MRRKLAVVLLAAALGILGCGQAGGEAASSDESLGSGEAGISDGEEDASDRTETEEQVDYSEFFQGMKLAKSYKGVSDANPIMTQRFGADPYAMVYGDRVYLYMTADALEYDGTGEVRENTYGSIQSISVVSTEDMANFTDHGLIRVAGDRGAAKWAHNSWAPAAAWKEIDGKPKFFLYFADNGGGIGVLTADSPTGPFRDELGKALITRQTPNCGDVLWLFDPAVLVDDDGRAYLYFGGGVPEGRTEHPGTARAVELGEDMMSIVGEPVVIDAPYLFEDSGIHKVGDTYYYTYCSNWQVDSAAAAEYGFNSAEIVSMESKAPLGPFTLKEAILPNPGRYFGLYGNNHHCVFSFRDKWYIAYHARTLEKKMGIERGYRSTHVEEFSMGEDGTIGLLSMRLKGREQIGRLDAYEPISGACMALAAGVDPVPADEVSASCGYGTMALGNIDSGDFVQLQGVDFGQTGPSQFRASIRCEEGGGVIRIVADLNGEVLGYLPVEPGTSGFADCRVELTQTVSGVHDVYFTFYGEGYEIAEWQFLR